MDSKIYNISLLIGAGFSIPVGYPTADTLSNRVLQTTYETFIIGPDGIVRYRMNKESETLPMYRHLYMELVDAIGYYNQYQCKGPFNYEEFYDYLESRISKNNDFRKYYESLHNTPEKNFCQDLTPFYCQILKKYLQPNKSKSYSVYGNFMRWILKMEKEGVIIHVHTLNHDLLMEELFLNKYTDGFSKDESPYFLKKPYRRTLPMYNGKYSGNIRLYKLHGSFDQYFCERDDNTQDYVKVPNGADYTNIYDINGVPYRENYHPDFLTGKTKERKYQTKPFYQNLITRFEENLIASKIVVIIGYSGNDDGINERLKKAAGKMIVISPTPNKNFNEEMQKAGWDVDIISKKIEEVTFEEFENIIGIYE